MTGQQQKSPDSFKLAIAVLLARATSRFFWLFNRTVLYAIADVCGLLFYLLFPTYRNNVIANVRHVLGDEAPDTQVRRVARSVFRTSARNFADLMRVPHLATDELLESVHTAPGTLERLDQASSSGRGGILVTAHYGAFDYVGQILWLKGYSLTLLTARTVPEFIDAGVNYLRGSRGARLEDATPGGLRRVISSLRRGELIGLIADRDFFQNGRKVVFFGKETTLPPGPVRIARDTGVPIIPTFARRADYGYYMETEEPFMVPKTDDPEADIQQGIEQLVAVFERRLRAAPEQWVMFQRVWTETPAQTVRVFPVGSPLDGKILGPSSEETGPLTRSPEDLAGRSKPERSSASARRAAPYQERPQRDPSGSS